MSFGVRDGQLIIGRGNQNFEVKIPELTLQRGTCSAIAGPSGSGKTSVLEFAALMSPPSRLDIFEIAGKDVRCISTSGSLDERAAFRAAHISFTVQSGGVLPFLTAEENALAGVRVLGRTVDASVRANLRSIACDLKVETSLSKFRSQLSGGERYRVGLLRSLLVPKSLVLVDEPTAALDDSLSAIVLQHLHRLADKHDTVVLIATHDVELARSIGFTIHEMLPHERGYSVENSNGRALCHEH